MSEPAVRLGWVGEELAAELPGLALAWAAFPARQGPSPAALKARLRGLADGLRGAQALAMRSQAIPHAYRVLFRHLGMDPDERRIPVEAIVLDRLRHGGFRSRSLVEDALLVATLETGVGLWALDADRVEGDLGLASARGALSVADAAGPVAELFAPPRPERAVTRDTRAICLYAVLAPSVPDIAAEEAIWTAWEIICP
jgi:DNA/RNA-binding domain of Phe-tRNA-synthetase-like protein